MANKMVVAAGKKMAKAAPVKNNKPNNNKPNASKPSASKPSASNSSKPSASKGNSGGSASNKTKPLPNATPKYGVGKQTAAQNHYNTQNSIRDYADQQHGKGLKIGDQSLGDHFNRELSQAEQDYLFNYAGSKGYGFGDAFGSRYAGQTAQDPGDPARPYRPGGLNAAMIDGGIGRKEIMARVDQRAKDKGKDFNKNNAYMRIADRWSSKGGALNIGALKTFNQKFEDKNPWASFTNQRFDDNGLTIAALGKNKSQNELYSAGKTMLDGKGYAKGDTFTRLLDGSLRAAPRIGNTGYMNQFTGGFGEIGLNTGGTGGGDTGLEGGGFEEPIIEEEEKSSGMMGGGNSGVGANALGIKRKKSSWAESRRNAGGTGNLARSNFSMGINTGLK